MNTCTGCNCHSPLESVLVDQFGAANHPCCDNDVGDAGTATSGRPWPCGFVMISGESCEHPWWKHDTPASTPPEPRRMLWPDGQYHGPFSSEPAAMYVATFLGKDCVHGDCLYVAKEGNGPYAAFLGGSPDTFCASPYFRAGDIESASGSTTGRDPYKLDADGNMVQPWPMSFDLRTSGPRTLFGGFDDDNPTCCWCLPPAEDTEVGNCVGEVMSWDGWTLHPGVSPNPLARSSPRITYQEGNDAFWDAVGKPDPWYGIDSTYGDGTLQFGNGETTQFALQNEEYWPSLPKRVCVVPIIWPYQNSPCNSLTEQCKSCAPSANDVPIGGYTYCENGLVISATVGACSGSPSAADVTGTVRSAGCGNGLIPTAELNGTLPSGVTDPGGPCGYYWYPVGGCGTKAFGVLVYWDGSAWKVKRYCSTDSGASYSADGFATTSNVVCGCAGIELDWEALDVECVCCSDDCECCSPEPDPLYASDGYGNTITLTLTAGVWYGTIPAGSTWGNCPPYSDPVDVTFTCGGDNCYVFEHSSPLVSCPGGTTGKPPTSCDPFAWDSDGLCMSGYPSDCGDPFIVTVTE